MKITERIREHLQPIFEGTDNQNNIEVRLWPLFPWLIISAIAGFFGQFLVPEGLRQLMSLACAIAAAAILAKPMARISKIKNKKNKD